MDESESSFTLVERACQGDERALNDLCTRYLPRLERWAHGRLPAYARGPLDTHDLVQEALAGVAHRIRTFEPHHKGAFQAYVRQALLNRVRDQIRHAGRRPTAYLDSDKASSDPSPLEAAIGREALERYEAALERLKPADRNAIILRVELGLSDRRGGRSARQAEPRRRSDGRDARARPARRGNVAGERAAHVSVGIGRGLASPTGLVF